MRLIESPFLIKPREDWSQVRSPSRARRRMKLGHRQRIQYLSEPDPSFYQLPNGYIVAHPETMRRLRERLS